MGRTKVDVDAALVERAMRLTGVGSKREAVEIALRRLIDRAKLYKRILALRGQLTSWEGDISAWRKDRTKKPR